MKKTHVKKLELFKLLLSIKRQGPAPLVRIRPRCVRQVDMILYSELRNRN